MDERGSVSVVVVGLLAVVGLVGIGLGDVGLAAAARARAQTAADAAALAAAQELLSPSGAGATEMARSYAERNGAELERCTCPVTGSEAVVTVVIDLSLRLLGDRRVRASARAIIDAPPGAQGLQPWFAARLSCLFQRVRGLNVVSGFRTRQEQARLHRSRPHLAAPPGRSRHEIGLAADLGFRNVAVRRRAHSEAPGCGLSFPISYEPWHVEPTDQASAPQRG